MKRFLLAVAATAVVVVAVNVVVFVGEQVLRGNQE